MKKGFTLVELMVVVMIMAVVVSLFVGAGVAIFFGVKACKKVSEDGIKPALEQVWNGPETNEVEVVR